MVVYTSTTARRSLIDTALFRTLSQVATILGYIVLVRGLDQHSFGVYNILYSFIPVMSMLASLGLVQTLRRYQPEYLSRGNPAAAHWLVRVVAVTRLGSNLVVLTAALLAWNLFAPLIKLGEYQVEFAIFSILILLYFQTRILDLALASHMFHRFGVGALSLLAFVKLAGYLLLTVTGQMTLVHAILVDIAGHACAYVLMRFVYWRRCARPVAGQKYSPDREERRRLLRYGLLNNFNDSGAMILTPKTDNFFIAAIMNPLGVAVYAFYTRLCEMALQLLPIRLFGNVIQPIFYATRTEEADERIPRYFSLLVNLNLLVLWPAVTYATLFHREIVTVVFGGRFVEDSWLLVVVMGFAMSEAFTLPLSVIAAYEEKAGVLLLSKWTAAYNLVALLALVPLAGVLGAAIATGSALAFRNLFVWWYVRRRAVWRNGSVVALKGLLLWTMAGAACWIVVGSSRVDLQACKLEYSIVSPK